MGYPIPIKLLVKNFKSHKSTVIPLGKVKEKCYTMGISGSGKSSVLEAIQYALGKDISNKEEFFHYTNIKAENTVHYEDRALIELTVKNVGPDYLHAYDEDEELTIVLEAFNGKNNRRYIRRANGDMEKITLSDLKEFGKHNDPLIFVDDTKTNIWPMLAPKQRYYEVAKFMKIEEFENNVKLTKKEFNEAEKLLDKAEEDLNIAYIDFKNIGEKYSRYLVKLEKEKELKDTKLECLEAQLLENIEQFQELQTELNQTAESIEDFLMRREKLRNQIKFDEGKIITIDSNIKSQISRRDDLNSQRDLLLVEVSNYDSNYDSLKKELLSQSDELPKQAERSNIESQVNRIKNLITEKSLKIAENKKFKIEYEGELELRKKDKLPLSRDILKLTKGLEDNGIPYEILAKTLEIKKGCEDWTDFLEVALGNLRLGIIVEEENRLEAQKVNRALNTSAFLLYPVKRYGKTPEKTLRNWIDLFSVETSKIPSNTVVDFLNLVMSSIYFAETPKQKEEYLERIPRSTIFCQDQFTYRIYSQRKLDFRNLSYYIGKGATERQIKILEAQIQELKSNIKHLGEEVIISQKEQRYNEITLEYISLSSKKLEFQQKKEKIKKLDTELLDINLILANPQEKINNLKLDIARNRELRDSYKEELGKIRLSFIDLQMKITNVSSKFNTMFNKFYVEQESLLGEINLSKIEIIETYRDKDYEYKAINPYIISLLEELERPTEDSKTLGYRVKTIQEVLETFNDIADDIAEKYEKQKLRIESIEKELEEFSGNKLNCQEKFDRAVENLENELRKWEKIVSKKFRDILRELKLDGVLNFSKVGDGQYELNINVSKIEGGSLLPIERSGFSKGQRRRVSIAFQTAILTQSDSSFFVWDEFDEGLDNYHRELLSKTIKKYLSNKKLIGITPIHPIKGYLETFEWIIELYLDANENTQVQIIKIKKEKKIIDAF